MYPNVCEILAVLALDNYGGRWRRYALPEAEYRWPADAARLEEEAARLTSEEKETMAAGEDTEQKAVIARHGVARLGEFLGNVFDGDLHYDFYRKGVK